MLLTPVLLAQSDARLIELAQAGHERAFEALVRRYRPQLLVHCRRILSADAAEDAVQHGLLGAWMALQNGSEVREARSWLHRVIHNAALRAISMAGGHAELTDVELGIEGPEEQLIRRQDLHDALRAMASLPELQREALIQTSVEGHSYASVAEMLGLSQTSLRGLIYRARATMRATASAVMPLPLLSWLLDRARRASARTPAVQAGSSAGAPAAVGSLLAKGGAVVLAVSAAAGGVGAAHLAASADPHRTHVHAVHRALSARLDVAITVDVPTSRHPSGAPAPSRHAHLARKLSSSGSSVVAARPAATIAAPAPLTIARATSGGEAGSSSQAAGRQSRSGSADSSSGWNDSSGGSGDGNGQASTSRPTTTDSESWSGSGDSTDAATTDTPTTGTATGDTTTTGATSTGSSSPGG